MTTVNEEGIALVEQSTFVKSKALAEFMEYIHTYLTDDECDKVLKAFELAEKAHEGQFRASGETYNMHTLAVADKYCKAALAALVAVRDFPGKEFLVMAVENLADRKV